MLKDKDQSHENSRIDNFEKENHLKDDTVDIQRDKDVSETFNKGRTTEKSLNLNPSSTSYYEPTKSSTTTKSQDNHDEDKITKFNGGLFVKSASEISNAGSLKIIEMIKTIYC